MDEGLPHQVKKSDVMSPFFIMQGISLRDIPGISIKSGIVLVN